MKKIRKCERSECSNSPRKNKYGNYGTYCSDECKTIHRKFKFQEIYKEKDLDAILAKRRATVMEKYGVDNVSRTESVRSRLSETTRATAEVRVSKTRTTNMARYGVESTNSLPEVQAKKKATVLAKYGVDHPLRVPEIAASVVAKNSANARERLVKAEETNLERYGCSNPSSNEEVKAKRTSTMLERFGVENASQNAEIHEKKMKSEYLAKDYTFPSGKTVRVQGHENLALDELLKTYSENEIFVGRDCVPTIGYDLDGISRVYFPDIYIPKENLLVEVKSAWTYRHNRPKTESKKDASIAAGYNYRFMIYNNGKWYDSIEDI